MDPNCKRQFWNTMKQLLSASGKSAVLTTTSMEEAEAVCERIGVLIKGELKCLGTSQFLKEKFGMAYMLEAKINMEAEGLFLAFIEQLTRQQASLVESFSNKFLIHIPRDCIKSLSQVFERLEKGKRV
jgi:ATP-binding cassette subfamily A (ABC1) protein 5